MGGVTSGYCATGSVKTATPPASVMTTEITVANTGRSMKNFENKEVSLYFVRQRPLRPSNPAVGAHGGEHGEDAGAGAEAQRPGETKNVEPGQQEAARQAQAGA